MINWLSNKIIKYFRNKAIAQINANPTEVARVHFKRAINLLTERHGEITNLYWIGSYAFSEDIPNYFKQISFLTQRDLIKFPFERSTEDDNIIDIFIGNCRNNDQLMVSFFSDNIELESNLRLIDAFFIEKEDKLNLSDNKEYLKII